MKREFSSFGPKPDQPEDCGEMTQTEIDAEREEIIASEQFGYDFIEYIRDNITPEQASKLGKLIEDGHRAMAGEYIFTLLYVGTNDTIRRIQESK